MTERPQGLVSFMALFVPLTLVVAAAFHLLGRHWYVPVLWGAAFGFALLLLSLALARSRRVRPPVLALALALVVAELGYFACQEADYLYFRQRVWQDLPAAMRTALVSAHIPPRRAVDDMLQAYTGRPGFQGYLRYRGATVFKLPPGPESADRMFMLWVVEQWLVGGLAGLGAFAGARSQVPPAPSTEEAA